MSNKFSVGDLVELSHFGQTVAGDFDIRYGIVVKGPYTMGLPDGGMPEGFHVAYDILIGDELIKTIPGIFLLRMDKDEEDNEGVEKMVMGDGPDS